MKTRTKEFLAPLRRGRLGSWLHPVLFFVTLIALDYGFQFFFRHAQVEGLVNEHVLRLLTPGWAALLTGIALLLPGALRRIFMIITGGVFAILAIVHGVFINMYGKFFSFADMNFAGDGAAFMDLSYLTIRKLLLIWILLCLAAVILSAILVPRKAKPLLKGGIPMAVAGLAVILGIRFTVLGQETKLIWNQHTDPSFLYENFSDDQGCLTMLGLYQYTYRDLEVIATAGGDMTDEERAALEGWMAGRTHESNEMSGIFEGKNLLMIQLESIDSWMLTESYMPNLYGVMADSLQFVNHYTPAYITAGTFNTEFMVNTSLMPAGSGMPMSIYTHNNFSNSMANLFAAKGYTAESFHGSEAEIYTRGDIHENLGYEKYWSGTDMGMYHYQFDRYLMSAYEAQTDSAPFFSFIITISGHGAYGPNNQIGITHQVAADAVAERTEQNYRYAVAHAMETDLYIGLLMEQLEVDGRLEDTVLVFYADHPNYYLVDNALLMDIKGVDDLNKTDNTPFFIYDGGKTTGTVEKVTFSLDVLPTVANLFNLDADYSAMLGHDAFSEDGGYCFWQDGTWFDGTQWSREVRQDIQDIREMGQLILSGDWFAQD